MPEFEVEIVLCKLDLCIPVLTGCSFFHRVTLYHSVRALLSPFFVSFCTLCLGLSFTFPPFEYVLLALTCVVFTSFSQSPVSPQCGSALSVCLTLLCSDACMLLVLLVFLTFYPVLVFSFSIIKLCLFFVATLSFDPLVSLKTSLRLLSLKE